MQMRAAILGLAALALAACGGPTPYQPSDGNEGFAEQRLEPDRYRVRVAGNTITDRETVQNQLLYRAAEITLQHGYARFVVVSQAVEPHTDYVTTDPFLFGPRRWPPFLESYETRAITRYEAWAEIKLYRGATGPHGPDSYEATAVLAQLRNAVLPPKPG